MNKKPITLSAKEYLKRFDEMSHLSIGENQSYVVSDGVEINAARIKNGFHIDNITFESYVTIFGMPIENMEKEPSTSSWSVIHSSKFLGGLRLHECNFGYLDCRKTKIGYISTHKCKFDALSLDEVSLKNCDLTSSVILKWLRVVKTQYKQFTIHEDPMDDDPLDEIRQLQVPRVITDNPIIAEQFRLFQTPVVMFTEDIRRIMAKKRSKIVEVGH